MDQWKKDFFTKTPGSHPEVKFGLEVMDPTPKRNLVYFTTDPTPKRNLIGSDGSHPKEKSRQRTLDPTPKEI